MRRDINFFFFLIDFNFNLVDKVFRDYFLKTNSREWKSFFLSRGENSFFENEFYGCFWEIFHEIDRSDQLFVARFICYEFGVEKLARVKRFLAFG